MSELQRQINHAKTLQESFSALSDSLGNVVMMDTSEKQPALDALDAQLEEIEHRYETEDESSEE